MMLVTSADKPYSSLAELAEHAKSNDVSLGVFGLNGPPALQTMKMAESLGFQLQTSLLTMFDLFARNSEIDVTPAAAFEAVSDEQSSNLHHRAYSNLSGCSNA